MRLFDFCCETRKSRKSPLHIACVTDALPLYINLLVFVHMGGGDFSTIVVRPEIVEKVRYTLRALHMRYRYILIY